MLFPDPSTGLAGTTPTAGRTRKAASGAVRRGGAANLDATPAAAFDRPLHARGRPPGAPAPCGGGPPAPLGAVGERARAHPPRPPRREGPTRRMALAEAAPEPAEAPPPALVGEGPPAELRAGEAPVPDAVGAGVAL